MVDEEEESKSQFQRVVERWAGLLFDFLKSTFLYSFDEKLIDSFMNIRKLFQSMAPSILRKVLKL